MAHKDLVDTAGIRTTRGSLFYRDHVPTRDALIVTRMRAAGAITVGKTNTPEFGAGSQTFNAVFGATRNPYDLDENLRRQQRRRGRRCRRPDAADCRRQRHRRLASQSSRVLQRRRAAAVARACGQRVHVVVAALGGRSDRAYGRRHGAVPQRDCGADPRSPLSIPEDPARFRAPLGRDFKGVRVAWWRGLGGIPFEAEIRRVVDANRQVFEDLGCVVEEAEPDFTGIDDAFPVLRYAANHPRYAPLVRQRPEWVKDTIKYEVAQAERASAADVGRAMARQARMYDQSRQFFERYEYFVLPVTQVEPFDVNTPYPTGIAGTAMTTYIDWMRSCWYVTMMANPAISVPARVLRDRAAGRPADRRPSPRRVERPAARPRVRAGDAPRRTRPVAGRLTPRQFACLNRYDAGHMRPLLSSASC